MLALVLVISVCTIFLPLSQAENSCEAPKGSCYRVAALIPARAGSKGIKDKNLSKLGNETLLSRTLRIVNASGKFDSVWISTDGEAIAKEAAKQGANVHWRDPVTGNDNASTMSVVEDFLKRHKDWDIIGVIQCTSPFIKEEFLTRALDLMIKTDAACVFSVMRSHQLRWIENDVLTKYVLISGYCTVGHKSIDTWCFPSLWIPLTCLTFSSTETLLLNVKSFNSLNLMGNDIGWFSRKYFEHLIEEKLTKYEQTSFQCEPLWHVQHVFGCIITMGNLGKTDELLLDINWGYANFVDSRTNFCHNSITPLNFDPQKRPRRQDWKGELIENGMFYFARTELILQERILQNDRCKVVEIPKWFSLEIDTLLDLKQARAVLSLIENYSGIY